MKYFVLSNPALLLHPKVYHVALSLSNPALLLRTTVYHVALVLSNPALLLQTTVYHDSLSQFILHLPRVIVYAGCHCFFCTL